MTKSIDRQASDLMELACELCPRCGAGEAIAFVDGTHNHLPDPCGSAAIWEAIHELYEQSGMEQPQ